MSDTIRDPNPSKPEPGTLKAPTSWVETRKEPLPPEDHQATIISKSGLEDFPEEVRPFVQDPNRQINQYILAKVLGKGGMGEVWKAWDRKLSRWAAIKFLLGQSEEGVLRFKREARMAARLTHPNIAPVHEVGEAPSRQPGQPSCHFLAMEYIDGSTLGSAKLSMRDKVDVFVKVAQGLEAAHKGGIVHRDIKPANIMLTKENWPYVMDFGLAKSLDGDNNLSASGAVMGTPAFMPPEQVEGVSDQIGPWSDVYSFGATMYAVFTGVMPFTAQTTLQLLQKVCSENPPAPRTKNPEIPAELEAIIVKTMAKKKEDRFQTAGAVADALKKVLLKMDVGEAQIVQAPPPPVAPVASGLESPSGSPVRILAAAMIALFVMIGFVVWWFLPHGSSAHDPVVAVKTDPKPEPKPEIKVDPKPEVKPEVKVQPQPEVKVDPKPEVKVEPKPELKPDVKVDPLPPAKTEPRPEVKPEVKVEPKPDVKPAAPTADDLARRGFEFFAARYKDADLASDSDYWAAYAMLRANPPPVARAKILEFLRGGAWEQSARATTCAALRVLALATANDPDSRARTIEGAHYLVNAQGRNGLWADGPRVPAAPFVAAAPVEGPLLISGDPAPLRFVVTKSGDGPDGDLAATPLALLALHAAQACGHKIPTATWKAALDGIAGKSGRDIASVYLCRQALGDPDPAQAPILKDFVKELSGSKDRSLSTLSALEQAGGLLSSPRLGDVSWATEGMAALTATQQPDGSWVDAGDPVRGTAKALLFLTKATSSLAAMARKGGPGHLEMKSLGSCPNVFFLLDGSGRMREELGDQERFAVAKQAIAKIVEKLPDGAIVGLRIFGNTRLAIEQGAETDTTLLVPPGPVNRRQMISHMEALKVKGRSLLTFSLLQVMEDLRRMPNHDEMNVVLLVDGNDADRRADAAPAVGDLVSIRPGLKVHVVGFNTEDEEVVTRLKRMAASGGGAYIPATSAKDVQEKLIAATIGEQEYSVLNDRDEVVLKGRLGETKPLADGRYTVVCGRARQDVWITTGFTSRIIVNQQKLAEAK